MPSSSIRPAARPVRFTIGRLAQSADVNIDTVRFYERQGLLARENLADEVEHDSDPDQYLAVRVSIADRPGAT